jgi:chromate transporter
LTKTDFLDRLASANLIPGPSSTELAIFVGYSKRGWTGIVVAGACFIFPAAVLVSCIAAAYLRYGSLPQAQGILYTIKPVVIAIIVQALWNLGRTAVKTPFPAALATLAGILGFLDLDPLLVLVCAGLVSASTTLVRRLRSAFALSPFARFLVLAIVSATQAVPVTLLRLFLSFLKIGAVVFGSGYVLLVFLRGEFTTHLHWLTEKQLIDAVAVGQFTPGPVFTTATLIGYLLARIPGAIVSTVGIFLPGFLLVAVSGPLIPKIRRSPIAGVILDGIVVGSLALIAVVAWQLARSAIVDRFTLVISTFSLVALIVLQTSSARLILAAALLGWIVKSH